MNTVPELIDALGGPTAFSRIIGKGVSTASEMKRSRSIPVDYWPGVMVAAKERGLPHVDEAMLARINYMEKAARRASSEAAE